ncbi:MAG: hypothetical protein IH940_13050 [Acidobacteria bacterium]|nr:hypothetical protein [Acidobacteriota bacterium]
MKVTGIAARSGLLIVLVMAMLLTASGTGAGAQPRNGASDGHGNAAAADAAQHWTPAQRGAATPRDLVIDHRGLAYLTGVGGSLEPYGHSVAAEAAPLRASAPAGARPRRGPSNGAGGVVSSSVTGMDPSAGVTIGSSYNFRTTVTDADGIKSVDFVIEYPDGRTGTFRASLLNGSGLYGVDFTGFSSGDWAWWVVAKDKVKKRGGNTTVSPHVSFTVDSGGGETTPPPPDGVVTNSQWTNGGAVQTAAGRLYFEMPANRRANRWKGYVCSGTAVADAAAGQSIILTAAHCVYDDARKAFARNVLFIPNQAETSGAETDLNCSNDPLGCWEPTHGVVDNDWASRKFPENIPWDYGYYVVPVTGAHTGTATATASLELAAGTLPIQFSPQAALGDIAHALGYSYSDDPNFMYCAEGLELEGSYNDYWLPSCELSGGSSGGPWVQPMNEATGSGPVVSVNSWGYTNSPGMGGAPLTNNAECVFNTAQGTTAPTNRGIVVSC